MLRNASSRSRGFTLIELLLVVVIIGVIAAFVLPRFADAKERAHVTAMKNDLRNLASAQELFKDEHSSYATSHASIPGYALSDGVQILNHQAVAHHGWAAVAGHQATSRVCFMSRFDAGASRVSCDGTSFGVDADNPNPGTGEPVTFTADFGVSGASLLPFASGSPAEPSVTWDFGDGTVVQGGLTASHTYASDGRYAVVAVGSADSSYPRAGGAVISVGDAGATSGDADPPAEDQYTLTINFVGSGAGAVMIQYQNSAGGLTETTIYGSTTISDLLTVETTWDESTYQWTPEPGHVFLTAVPGSGSEFVSFGGGVVAEDEFLAGESMISFPAIQSYSMTVDFQADSPASPAFDLGQLGAVVIRGDVDVRKASITTISGGSAPGFAWDGDNFVESGSAGIPEAFITGSPRILAMPGELIPQVLTNFGGYTWASLTSAAHHVLPGGIYHATTFPSGGIVHVTGNLELQAGVDFDGILIVDGDVGYRGSVSTAGLVLVAGNVEFSGSGNYVSGQLRVVKSIYAPGSLPETSFIGNISIAYDPNAIAAAVALLP